MLRTYSNEKVNSQSSFILPSVGLMKIDPPRVLIPDNLTKQVVYLPESISCESQWILLIDSLVNSHC